MSIRSSGAVKAHTSRSRSRDATLYFDVGFRAPPAARRRQRAPRAAQIVAAQIRRVLAARSRIAETHRAILLEPRREAAPRRHGIVLDPCQPRHTCLVEIQQYSFVAELRVPPDDAAPSANGIDRASRGVRVTAPDHEARRCGRRSDDVTPPSYWCSSIVTLPRKRRSFIMPRICGICLASGFSASATSKSESARSNCFFK